MTDLQMTLFAAGGAFIVGVFSYNKWQEYKAKKSVERAFSTDHDDVLMRAGGAPADEPALPRHEPSFESVPDAAAVDAPAAGDGHGAPADGAEGAERAPQTAGGERDGAAGAATRGFTDDVPSAPEQATCMVDPLIDCLLPLVLEEPVRGEQVLPVLQTLRLVGNKPVHYIGLHTNGQWEPVAQGGVYTKLQGGMQLASRSTALNELEYSELVTRLRVVADGIGAEPEIPDMIEVMAEARTLHRFVAGHDAQLGVNLRSNGAPWAVSTLLGALERQGFDMRPDGRFVMPGGEGTALFTLSTNVTLAEATTARLTLLLDVPCVAPARDGFGAMITCARALVGRLDATIVDDGDLPLSDAALTEIAGQVREFYDEMEAADIPAGSVRALRLFS